MLSPRMRFFLPLWLLATSSAAVADVASPHDPLRFKTQDEMLRSLKTIVRVFRELPADLYRCVGLLSDDGWTGRTIRRNPAVAGVLDELFAYRTSDKHNFEKLCFVNGDADYGGIITTDHGVCAGVTTMNWIANYLALFDETGKTFQKFHPEFKLPKKHTVESFGELIARKAEEARKVEEAEAAIAKANDEEYFPVPKTKLDREERMILDFYAPFIDRMFREKKPTVFPYFTTTESFSAHPAIKAYLLKLSVETWYDVNVSFSSFYEAVIAGGWRNTFDAHEVGRLNDRLDAYLKLKVQPIIFIHLPDVDGTGKSIHILRVVSKRWSDNGDAYHLQLVDPNFGKDADIHKLVVRKIKSRPDEVEAVYEPYRADQTRGKKRKRIISLTDVEIAPFFDRLSNQTMKGWRDWIDEEGDAILERLRETSENRPSKKPKARLN